MINIFEVFSKSFTDYRNNFFKTSLLSLVIFGFYEGSFYTYMPMDIFKYFVTGVNTFDLRFLLGIIVTFLIGSVIIFGVYDYFLRISRQETYGFIVLKGKHNLKTTVFLLIAAYILIIILLFLMPFLFGKIEIIRGRNPYLHEYAVIITDFIPVFAALFYSFIFFVIIDNPEYSVRKIIGEYFSLFRFIDIFNIIILYITFALLKYTAELTRGFFYIFFIPLLFLFLANYYNELYFRKNVKL